MAKTKESVYDDQIYPLMAEIIRICKEHRIAMVASFALGNDESAGTELVCSTALLADEYSPPRAFLDALSALKRPPSFIAATITTEGR